VGAVVYLTHLGDEEETKAVVEWVKKWSKQAPVMLLGDFNTSAAINRRLIDTLELHSDLVDIGANNRGLNTTKGGTRIDRLLTTNRCEPDSQLHSP
jgi:endonuclease/exonuclease/phosphatase family metal-dependent hydrolase